MFKDKGMYFRPCIDLHDGMVKQIVGSSLTDAGAEENFVSDKSPAYYAGLYKHDKLAGGHVIKLGPGNDEAAKTALNAYYGGLQLGGGVNDKNARYWLEQGAEKLILTSFIFFDGALCMDNLQKIFAVTGREKLVLDLSCRIRDGRYYIVTDRWQKFTDYEVNKETLKFLSDYCSEYLIHAVDVEGRQSGIDLRLIELMGCYSPVPSVYAGGIASLDDIKMVLDAGNGQVAYTVGSALDIFGGSKLRYDDVVKFDRDCSC